MWIVFSILLYLCTFTEVHVHSVVEFLCYCIVMLSSVHSLARVKIFGV